MTLRGRRGRAGPGARLLLLGVSARALARSACAGRLARRLYPGGITVLDFFGDWDLRRLPVRALSLRRDLGRPRSTAALLRTALALPGWDALAYAGGIENRPGLLEALERRGAVLGNGARVLRAARDPGRFFGFLQAAGIPHAATRIGARAAAPPAGAGRRPALWKPRRSGGGGRLLAAAPGEPPPRGFYLQERLRGTPASVAFLADGRRAVLLGASEQIVGFRPLGGRGFRYGGSIAGPARAILGRGNVARLAAAATAITRRFGLSGLNGLDVIVTRDGAARIIEINPRFTASMELIEELAGRNLFDLHLGALAGRLPAWKAPAPAGRARFLAKGILYADRPLAGGRPEALLALGCRDVPVPGEAIAPGQPVLTLTASGATPAACREGLARRARQVRRVLAACAKIPGKRANHRQFERRSGTGRAGGVFHGIL